MVWRKDDGYIGRRMLRMELPGKRKRGRPKRRFMDVVKKDMAEVEMMDDDAEDRTEWRWQIRSGDPGREKSKEDEESLEVKRVMLHNIYQLHTHAQTHTYISVYVHV